MADPFLVRVLDRVQLVDAWPEIVRIATECDAKQFQESVHAVEQRLRRIGDGVHRRRALEHDDPVGQVGGHDEIVLDHEARFLGVQNVPARVRGGDKSICD